MERLVWKEQLQSAQAQDRALSDTLILIQRCYITGHLLRVLRVKTRAGKSRWAEGPPTPLPDLPLPQLCLAYPVENSCNEN